MDCAVSELAWAAFSEAIRPGWGRLGVLEWGVGNGLVLFAGLMGLLLCRWSCVASGIHITGRGARLHMRGNLRREGTLKLIHTQM